MKTGRLLTLALVALSATACAYHSARDAEGLLDVADSQTTAALVDLDVRPTQHPSPRGDSPMGKMALLVPLWPWVEMVEESGEANHYPADYLVDQIRKSRMTRAVRFAPDLEARERHVLQVTISRSEVRETTTLYGLSIPGALLQLLAGLPSQSRSAELALVVKLTDPDGRVLLEKHYAAAESRLAGLWAPLWVYGPQFSYGQHANLMARSAEGLTRQILADLREVLPR